MKYFSLPFSALALAVVTGGSVVETVQAASADASKPYKILNTTQTMGTGGIDYVYADSDGRRLYIPRGNQVLVFDLDTLKSAGTTQNTPPRRPRRFSPA